MPDQKRKTGLKSIIILQLIVIIYTFSTFFGKMASGNAFMSAGFLQFILLDIAALAVYALLWQQALKKFDLHVAYANRSVAIIWGMVWAALFLGENITVTNMIGAGIIIAGMVVVNTDAE